ncbi:hypothetical protein BST61_g1985 [Cercospora zeina]
MNTRDAERTASRIGADPAFRIKEDTMHMQASEVMSVYNLQDVRRCVNAFIADGNSLPNNGALIVELRWTLLRESGCACKGQGDRGENECAVHQARESIT